MFYSNIIRVLDNGNSVFCNTLPFQVENKALDAPDNTGGNSSQPIHMAQVELF